MLLSWALSLNFMCVCAPNDVSNRGIEREREWERICAFTFLHSCSLHSTQMNAHTQYSCVLQLYATIVPRNKMSKEMNIVRNRRWNEVYCWIPKIWFQMVFYCRSVGRLNCKWNSTINNISVVVCERAHISITINPSRLRANASSPRKRQTARIQRKKKK